MIAWELEGAQPLLKNKFLKFWGEVVAQIGIVTFKPF